MDALEGALAPYMAPLCCVLMPLALCARAGLNVGALLATCAGFSRLSTALSAGAAQMSPRVVLLLLVLYGLWYLAWHFAIMGEQGALEWGDLSPKVENRASAEGAVGLPAGKGGYEAAAVPRLRLR